MKAPEEIILSNAVGTITKQTVKIKPAKGGPLTINMADILSITYQLKRRYFLAALGFLFGLGSLLVAFFPVEGNRMSVSLTYWAITSLKFERKQQKLNWTTWNLPG